MTSHDNKGRAGQAMVELLVGLIAVLVVSAGLLQLTSLCTAQTEAIVEARRSVGLRSISDVPIAASPQYIRFWREGADGYRYSADDTTTRADPQAFQTMFVQRAVRDPADWTVVDAIPGNPLTSLRGNPMPVTQFGLLGEREDRTIPVIPIVQRLLYDANTIEIRCESWMTWTREIY